MNENWSAFTHNVPDDEDWSKLYPYTIIAYRHAERITLQCTYAHEVEQMCHTDHHSVGIIVTPNGVAWKREAWLEQYDKCCGVLVDPPAPQADTTYRTITYRPEHDTILTITEHGDRSVGMWPGTFTIVVPFSNRFLKEEPDFAQDIKTKLCDALTDSSAFETHISSALYDFESDEIADRAEVQSEIERGQ